MRDELKPEYQIVAGILGVVLVGIGAVWFLLTVITHGPLMLAVAGVSGVAALILRGIRK